MLNRVSRKIVNMTDPFSGRVVYLSLLLPMLVACIADGEDLNIVISFNPSDEPTALINTAVQAGVGGAFTSSDGRITVRIPAEAITEDSTSVPH